MEDKPMKKKYITPETQFIELHAYDFLTGSAKGSVDPSSMFKETEETMSSRKSSSLWDEDMD